MSKTTLFLGWVFVIVGGSLWIPYVETVMWAWWVAPAFHLPAITIAQAIGISATFAMMLGIPYLAKSKDAEDADPDLKLVGSMGLFILGPAFALLFGYLARFITL